MENTYLIQYTRLRLGSALSDKFLREVCAYVLLPITVGLSIYAYYLTKRRTSDLLASTTIGRDHVYQERKAPLCVAILGTVVIGVVLWQDYHHRKSL